MLLCWDEFSSMSVYNDANAYFESKYSQCCRALGSVSLSDDDFLLNNLLPQLNITRQRNFSVAFLVELSVLPEGNNQARNLYVEHCNWFD